MQSQVKTLKKLGYDVAIKAWANNELTKTTPCPGFYCQVWKPGECKATLTAEMGLNPTECLKLIIKRIKEREPSK